MRISKAVCWLFVLTICFLFNGCTSEKLSDVELPIPDQSSELNELDERPSTLRVTTSDVGVSPAATPFKIPDINTPPEHVCKQFVELLNRGDSKHFELLLTPAALNVSNKLNFSLPPLADEHAKIEVGVPQFGTIREKLCFVDCKITDTESTDLTMMLRNSKKGWRVAGMMVEGETVNSKNLLSFENLTDVGQIRESLQVSAD